jgi:hypothetical protein
MLRGYLLWAVLANLGWEIIQLPLYTIWHERDLAYNVYAVLHCTAGDVIIAGATLIIALALVGGGRWPADGFGPVLLAATAGGLGYTVYSEWLNTGVRLAWAYSDWMPVVPGLGTGLAPLLQWLVLPPLGLWLIRRRCYALTRR